MATLRLEHLRRQVVWCAANCAFAFSLVKNLGGQAEITDLETHAVSEEEIAKFEIAMNDFPRVNVLDALDQLIDVVASFDLVQALPSLNQVGQGLVLADIKHDVDVLFVFKITIKAHHILVIQ